ncbi:MAG TPA: hypothetical protein EYQ81_09465 [Sneathiellales bacterium]|nr:hypothetical protein [Sneathiellales bacterium]
MKKVYARAVLRMSAFGRRIRALQLRTPYNLNLQAHNVFELDVDPEIVDEATEIYANYLRLNRDKLADGHARKSGVFLAEPGDWGSNIIWISADDETTHNYLKNIFYRLKIADRFKGVVNIKNEIRLFCCFFVSRSQCDTPYFHSDYFGNVGANAFTFMTPLYDYSGAEQAEPQLLYLDIKGNVRAYTYKKGKAVAFGELFQHSTAPCNVDEPYAFLCFTFGSDKPKYWNRIRGSIDTQSRIFCNQAGLLVESDPYRPGVLFRGWKAVRKILVRPFTSV